METSKHDVDDTPPGRTKVATPAEARINALESDAAHHGIEIIREPPKIEQTLLDLIATAREEVLFLFPTSNAFHREERIGAIDSLVAAASKGVSVSILTPADSAIEHMIHTLNSRSESGPGMSIGFRKITEARTRDTVTILAVDRKSSLVIEQRDDLQPEFNHAVGIATYSTSNSTVLAAIRFFERMWEGVEMREREELLLERERSSRMSAELLQNILSHDMRNFNQIAKFNAEMLKENQGMSTADRERILNELTKAIDQSTDLIDKAKRLGKIMAQQKVKLEAEDLQASFERSMSIVRAANPHRSIRVVGPVLDQKPLVMADDLLDEVITNILSNAVKYTEGPEVNVKVEIDSKPQLPGSPGHDTSAGTAGCWRLGIADHGRGIPDDLKGAVFSRYLETAKGSGLGLSIVRALVVERYSGTVGVRNRIEGDYSKGTIVEIAIPKAL